MNAVMNIQVRVINGNARAALRSLQGNINAVNSALGATGRSSILSSRGLTAWGNQLQWTGRQIQYNFTLPLVAAGTAAARWELANEQAATRVSKVYGDASLSASTLHKELKSLDGAFQALSDHFGVQQQEVLSIAGDWAAAGSSGIALAKSVQTTLEAMVLGELSATDATQALIAIQAQYGLSSAKLSETIGILNAVENQTGISMGGLIQGFARAAGVARLAGVDVRHLAAMLAAISPAAGGAAEAGNALKTIFSRLSSPTKESAQVLGLMGINLDSMTWKTSTAVEQLQIMSKSFEKLSDKQKEVVSTVVASRWQINKFSILMHELSTQNGYYQKALDATASRQQVFTLYQKELNTVLNSNPQRMKQIWVMLQNAATDIIQPMLPLILYLANAIRTLVTSFSNLNPALQKLILFGAIGIAIVGPLLRYFGALTTLVGSVGSAFAVMLRPVGAALMSIGRLMGAAVTGIWALWSALINRLVVLTTAGWRIISVAWRVGLATIRTLTAVFLGPLGLLWSSILVSLSTLTAQGWALIVAAWRNAMLLLGALQVVMGVLISRAYSAMMIGLAAITSYVYPVITRAWYAMYAGIWVAINAGQRLILTGYRIMAMGLTPITVAAGKALQAAWYAVTLGVEYLLLAGTVVYNAIWRLWAYGLGPITAAAGRLITAAWVATLRAQMIVMSAFRTAWSAIWGGLVAVASLGSRLITLASGFATTAMTFMAAAPGRLLGLFRAGWAALAVISRAGAMGMIRGFAALGSALLGAISWPVVAALAVIAVLVAVFWKQIKTGWDNVRNYFSDSGNSLVTAVKNIFGSLSSIMTRVFNLLPQSVENAMLAVVKIVATAARKVYELFSYINPFAHHSPSLVENVTKGMQAVRDQFATLAQVEQYVKSAYRTIQQFGSVTAGLSARDQAAQYADMRKKIVKESPGAGPAFDAMVRQVQILTPILNQLKVAVDAQQQVVDSWSKSLDKANDALDIQKDKLSALQSVADDLQNQLSSAQDALQNWANAPIQGQQAMSDLIFSNTMAQKKLQLQMMDMEKVTGPLDDVKNRMAAINGQIDQLQGLRKDLQQQGAGSDILSIYDSQISGLKGQGSGISSQAKALQDLQDQLDNLQTEGQRLDLVNSLEFDPLTRQIEQASQTMKEMPFDVIMAGIQSSREQVDKLTAAYDKANDAVKQQQAVVDAATKARDAIQARYDAESKKLQQLKDAYDSVNQAIQDINSSLNAMSQAADNAIGRKKGKKDSLTNGAQNFVNAAGGNFPDPGSDVAIGREGGPGDQSAQIDQFTKDLAKQTSGMFSGLNPLTPLKKWWNKAWAWLQKYVGPLFSGLGDLITQAFSGMPDIVSSDTTSRWTRTIKDWVKPTEDMFSHMWGTIQSIFKTTWGWIQKGWKVLAPVLKGIWGNLVDGLQDAWNKIRPQISQFKDLIKPIGDAFSNLWTLVKPIVAIITIYFANIILLIANLFKDTIQPLLSAVGQIVAGVIEILLGVIKFIVGVLTLNWTMAWNGISDIFLGAWRGILGILDGIIGLIVGVIEGFIDYVTQVLSLVWNKVVIPAWNKAWGWISSKASSVWNHDVIAPMKSFGSWVSGVFTGLWSGVTSAWNASWSWLDGKAHSLWSDITAPMKTAYNWITTTLKGSFDPVIKAFQTAWNNLGSWFTKNQTILTDPLKSAINSVIGLVNKLIDGLNKVADVLPGFDWHISGIPKLAAGGGIPSRAVGSGFKTNGPRAIVGEGNQRYPEYVIPTDPQHRRRAMGLFQMLAGDIGAQSEFMGIPAFGLGGVIGTISDAMGSAGSFFTSLPGDALKWVGSGITKHILKPIIDTVDPLINKVPWDFARGMAKAFKVKLEDWISIADDVAKDKVEKGGAANVPDGQVKNWILGALKVINQATDVASGIYNIIMHESGGNPNAINRTDSNAKQGYDMMSKGLMQTTGPTFRAWAVPGHRNIWAPIDNIIAGTRYALNRYGRDWLKAGGNKDASGNYIGYSAGGILKGIPSLAKGGYINRKIGGTLVRVGEGRTDEAVVPLPNGMSDLKGGSTYNFYGDLSFPNITSGDDAKKFLDNLASLAED